MSVNHSQDSDHIHHPQTFPPALYNLSLPPPRLPNTDVRSIIIDLFAFSRVKWSRTGCVFFFFFFFWVCLFHLGQLLWDPSMFLRWWSLLLLLSGTPSDEYTLISLSRCLLMDICVVSSFWLSHIRPLWTFCTSRHTTFSLLPGKSLRGGASGSESRCV